MSDFPTLDELRDCGNKPKLHPNGFLQLEFRKNKRFHVWLPTPPVCRKIPTPIHDHVFDFTSVIYAGVLQNRICEFVPDSDGAYHLYQVPPYKVHKIEYPLKRMSSERYRCVEVEAPEYARGQSYTMPIGAFHESINKGFAVSIITFGHVNTEDLARIACPYDQEPDNEFRRDSLGESIVWDIIREACEVVRSVE